MPIELHKEKMLEILMILARERTLCYLSCRLALNMVPTREVLLGKFKMDTEEEALQAMRV